MPTLVKPVSSPHLLNVQAVAEMLGCSPRHVLRLVEADALPRPVRLGALVRWQRSAIEKWIDNGCRATEK
jgi:excisionase family DNA binding protein